MRMPMSKKTRFEVFKRDSFACRYCGARAPSVVLHVDHVIPVAAGGDDRLINLVTACFDCNAGKSDRPLSDDAVINSMGRTRFEDWDVDEATPLICEALYWGIEADWIQFWTSIAESFRRWAREMVDSINDEKQRAAEALEEVA